MIVIGRPVMAMDRALRSDAIALDRGSVRRMDEDGRLHVAVSNISKANICPYRGAEIPEYESLGLDPEKVYQLLRHPDELAKGAATFNNLPILSEHVPVSAEDHQPDLVVGSTGTDADFADPHLRNSLVIWKQDAIDRIQSGRQRELSAAYRYDADMTPGKFKGARYDGVMRNIRGNHVALVRNGRAGADVVVGDEALPPNLVKEKPAMAKKAPLSRRALVTQSALAVMLPPLMAADAKIDLRPMVAKITQKNWKTSKAKLAADIKTALTGKLAADADLDDVVQMLDKLDDVADEADTIEQMVEAKQDDPAPMDAKDADPMAAIMEYLATVLSDEQLAKVQEMMAPDAATDEAPPFAKKDDAKKEGEKPDGEKEKPMSKQAMDAAIDKRVKEATAALTAKMEARRLAERAVLPFIGALDNAPDNADDIYKMAFDHLEIDVAGVHPSAYPKMLEMAGRTREAPKPPTPPALGMDAASNADFHSRFTGAARIGAA